VDPFIPAEPVWRTTEWLLQGPFEHNADGSRRPAWWGYRSITDCLACLNGVAYNNGGTKIHWHTSRTAQVTRPLERHNTNAFTDVASNHRMNIHKDAPNDAEKFTLDVRIEVFEYETIY